LVGHRQYTNLTENSHGYRPNHATGVTFPDVVVTPLQDVDWADHVPHRLAAEERGHVSERPVAHTRDMTTLRLDHVSVVVDDLEAAIAFFVELGMELEGKAPIEGRWVDRVNSLDGVRVDIAMMRTPDGRGRLELTKFHSPTAVSPEPENALGNTLGLRSIMFTVDDIDVAVAGLRAHGAELVGEVAQYEDMYRLCYVRGPEGIIVALAEPLSGADDR
jgi:catechol 2,3-dioxygenase-like lactoylglutathione lyase family enzyme